MGDGATSPKNRTMAGGPSRYGELGGSSHESGASGGWGGSGLCIYRTVSFEYVVVGSENKVALRKPL